MSKLFKSEYMLLIFLIVNMTAENIIFASISKTIFYCVLALSVPVCLLNIKIIKEGDIYIMKNFLNNYARLIMCSFFLIFTLSIFIPFFRFFLIPYIILSIYVWVDIFKSKMRK